MTLDLNMNHGRPSGKISALSCGQNVILSCSVEDDMLKTWDIESGIPISA